MSNFVVAGIALFFVILLVLAFFGRTQEDETESTRFIEEQEAEVAKPVQDDWVI